MPLWAAADPSTIEKAELVRATGVSPAQASKLPLSQLFKEWGAARDFGLLGLAADFSGVVLMTCHR